MNNEPVAWMLADKEAEHIRSIMAVQHDFVPEGCVEIALYTHPVKEPLTNEEIEDEWFKVFKPETGIGKNLTNGVYEFAMAILRKAQEK